MTRESVAHELGPNHGWQSSMVCVPVEHIVRTVPNGTFYCSARLQSMRRGVQMTGMSPSGTCLKASKNTLMTVGGLTGALVGLEYS